MLSTFIAALILSIIFFIRFSHGVVMYTSGDQVLNFDGTSSTVIDLSSTFSCVKGNLPRSVSFDIQTTKKTSATLIATGTTGASRSAFAIGIGMPNYSQSTGPTDGVIGVVGWDADYNPRSPFISDGNWHSVLISYDGTTLQIWIDGVLTNVATQNTWDSTGNRSIFYNTVGDNNFLGSYGKRSGSGYYFIGKLKKITLYDTAVLMTDVPSCLPITAPSAKPSTAHPTYATTFEPTNPSTTPTTTKPTTAPSTTPTTTQPTTAPSAAPTTAQPTTAPSAAPTTAQPITAPSTIPTSTQPISLPVLPTSQLPICPDGWTLHCSCQWTFPKEEEVFLEDSPVSTDVYQPESHDTVVLPSFSSDNNYQFLIIIAAVGGFVAGITLMMVLYYCTRASKEQYVYPSRSEYTPIMEHE